MVHGVSTPAHSIHLSLGKYTVLLLCCASSPPVMLVPVVFLLPCVQVTRHALFHGQKIDPTCLHNNASKKHVRGTVACQPPVSCSKQTLHAMRAHYVAVLSPLQLQHASKGVQTLMAASFFLRCSISSSKPGRCAHVSG
jgi:hypothetical protein